MPAMRLTIWLDPATCTGVDNYRRVVHPTIGVRRKHPRLVDYLDTAYAHARDTAEVVTVFVTGPRPRPPRGGKVADWLLDTTPGWLAARHYMDADRPVGRFTTDTDTHPARLRVELRRAAELFPEHLTADECRAAWELVAGAWRAVWDTALLTSLPASGRITLAMCGAGDWQPIDPDTAALIRNTAPQHRIELVKHYGQPGFDPFPSMMPGFVYLDARWSYVALLRELHAGEPTRLIGEVATTYAQLHPYDRARYRVRFAAPDGWQHVGAFMCKHGDAAWHAPLRGETWCDSAELFVARAHGWHVDILEGMVWDGAQRQRALDMWRDRMMRVAEYIGNRGGDDAQSVTIRDAARGVVRGVILQTLGAMHSTGAHNVVYVPNASDAPPETRATLEPRGEGWTYVETVPLTGAAAIFAHPEITAQIWGRAHARILDHRVSGDRRRVPAGAWHVDPYQLVAIHGDAIYLTTDPRWPDDGAIGRMRVKGTLTGPLEWPTTMRDVYALARKAEAQ